jgi:hypothetical protein
MKRQKEHANPGNQKKKKRKDNFQNLVFLYNSQGAYILLTEELDIILKLPKLTTEVFNVILDDRTLDKLSTGDILEKYEHFTERQLGIINKYIHSHLYDKNTLFVSDLIDCANWNNIESDTIFDFCLDTIKKRRTLPMVLSAIMYVFEHMRISQSIYVVPVLERVINNKTYCQNCRIIAAFCLFRITMNPMYLQIIKELVSIDKDLHIVLTNKMLLMDYNRNKRYFFYGKEDFL